VVIPVKDAGKTLPAQLEALAGQDFDEPFELVVADNGSTDRSVAAAEAWAASFASFRVLDASAVAGRSHARNAGARAATGELIAFCDADDVVHPGWLAALVAAAPNAHLIGGRLDVSGNDARSAAWYDPPPTDRLPAKQHAPPVVISANMAVWREAFEAIGGFDEQFVGTGEETDLCLRAHLAGFATGYAPDAVIDYRYRGGLKARLRQAWGEGLGEAELESRFGGVLLPEHTASQTLRRTVRLVRAAPGMLRRPNLRGRWLARAVRVAGMTAGRSRRHRASSRLPRPGNG
jgi:GT2 family glycosyltransferase